MSAAWFDTIVTTPGARPLMRRRPAPAANKVSALRSRAPNAKNNCKGISSDASFFAWMRARYQFCPLKGHPDGSGVARGRMGPGKAFR